MGKKARSSSCEVPVKTVKKSRSGNRQYRYGGDFKWRGVKSGRYKSEGGDWAGIARQVLIGDRGETAEFHLRYFEIEAGGYSSFEKHKHEHVVIGVRGRGKAKLNRRITDIQFLDVLYIGAHTHHRLYNPFQEPFGFFCIVNARRDRPRPVKK